MFLGELASVPISSLYGVTDGKAVGTFVEVGLHAYLKSRFTYTQGSAASGIDFPELLVDLKVTSSRQPQSSCPFRSAHQKVYGLGYDLLVCVYEKADDHIQRTAKLAFRGAVMIQRERTADYQTTYGIQEILRRQGNLDDIIAFLEERNLPLDEVGRHTLADQILRQPPQLGCLTISNALQWRLQYGRAILLAATGTEQGVSNILE